MGRGHRVARVFVAVGSFTPSLGASSPFPFLFLKSVHYRKKNSRTPIYFFGYRSVVVDPFKRMGLSKGFAILLKDPKPLPLSF